MNVIRIAFGDPQQNHDSGANLAHHTSIHAYARMPYPLDHRSHAGLQPRVLSAFLTARFERGAGWHRGQKKLLRPATVTRRIFAPQRKQGLPSRP